MKKSIVLGGGCFWCIEAIYQRVQGVVGVRSGYAGGSSSEPDYYNHADHAETIEASYDPSVVSLETLLDVFFHVHDPTTLNCQGNDVGAQYRSSVLHGQDEGDTVRKVRDAAQAD